jgi:hypothetical protein
MVSCKNIEHVRGNLVYSVDMSTEESSIVKHVFDDDHLSVHHMCDDHLLLVQHVCDDHLLLVQHVCEDHLLTTRA